jgi:hypothetical protein
VETAHLCALKDVYSNEIVGYSVDSRIKASLAVAASAPAIDQKQMSLVMGMITVVVVHWFRWREQRFDGCRCSRRADRLGKRR